VKRLVLVVVGFYLFVVGAVVHRHVLFVGGVDVPWALVLVVAATWSVVVAADAVQRLGSAWLGVGWGAGLMVQQFSPGGSYLVASDWLGWAFTLLCLGVIVAGMLRAPRLGA
jgi:hypothetical protein